MSQFIFVVHFFLALALILVVLLQKSEGGALGIGGSSSFLSARGRTNALSRTTALLAALFFITSIGLTILAHHTLSSTFSPFEGKAPSSHGDILPKMPPAPSSPPSKTSTSSPSKVAPEGPRAPLTP